MRRTAGSLLALLIPLVHATGAFATITPMSQLHVNDANGLSLLNGQAVTVQGTVTTSKLLFQPSNVDFHLQDATGGADVFQFGTGSFTAEPGDSLEVTGTLTQFNGLMEISSPLTVTHLGTGVTPVPLVLTCLDVANSYNLGTNTDANESRLIRVNNVTITSGTWPAAGVNGTLTINDGTGPTILFIDKDTNVDGSTPPPAVFNIVGILRQFDSSSPYTTGYEIVPRAISDVSGAGCQGPELSVPTVEQISSTGVTITWTTDSPSTSVVDHGTTSGMYTGNVTDPSLTTTHTVALTGLDPRTLYYFQVSSTDGDGTCDTPEHAFVTFPAPNTPGEIQVYFNQDVDHSVSTGTDAQQFVDMPTKAIELINSAKRSIDATFYYFDIPAITDALIAAKNRGVQVRLILGQGNSPTEAARLDPAGIPYIYSNFGGNHAAGIMHSKYILVDAAPGPKDDAYVWTGSWNCFAAAMQEANNVIVFHDYGMAAAFTLDFNQMWGSSTATPNAATSKMGAFKVEVIPHQFEVGGIRVEGYMSPSDIPETRMIQYIQQAQHSQLFCIFDFTSDPLSLAMRAHRDSVPGFVVSGMFEGSQVGQFSEWCNLDNSTGSGCTPTTPWTPRADVFKDVETQFTILHHKYQIFDEGWPAAAVWTGSHNWSSAAKTNNDENIVVVHDPTIANLYYQEWTARYRASGGTALSVDPVSTTAGVALAACRPNPSSGPTTFRYSIARDAADVNLAIFDVTGRTVRTLVSGAAHAGTHQVAWDGRDDSGRLKRAGVYYYRLRSGGETRSRLLVLTH